MTIQTGYKIVSVTPCACRGRDGNPEECKCIGLPLSPFPNGYRTEKVKNNRMNPTRMEFPKSLTELHTLDDTVLKECMEAIGFRRRTAGSLGSPGGDTSLQETLYNLLDSGKNITETQFIKGLHPSVKAQYRLMTLMGGFPVLLPVVNSGNQEKRAYVVAQPEQIIFSDPEPQWRLGWHEEKPSDRWKRALRKDARFSWLKSAPVDPYHYCGVKGIYAVHATPDGSVLFESNPNKRSRVIITGSYRGRELQTFHCTVTAVRDWERPSDREHIILRYERNAPGAKAGFSFSISSTSGYTTQTFTFDEAGYPDQAAMTEQSSNYLRRHCEKTVSIPTLAQHGRPTLFGTVAASLNIPCRAFAPLDYATTLKNIAEHLHDRQYLAQRTYIAVQPPPRGIYGLEL